MTRRAHQSKRPTDTVTARETAQRLLGEDADLPTGEELDMLRLQLRWHAMLLIPVLETAVQDRPEDAPERVTAADVIAEARARLASEPRNTLPAEVAHAQSLSRSVLTLADALDSLRLVSAGP
ncbi:hypothetical protein GCM10010406_46380 [Streptomyces thermolineatus]|uniref:Uncharacterized protein n=1 Tax=Streptomyces thermolineatus TaxID=44033 RepID=A0ABN3MM52_9ACTN